MSKNLIKIQIFSFLILMLSCKDITNETRYYPDKNLFANENAEIIGLDTTKLNFKQITNKVGTYYEGFGKLVVELKDGKIKKRIIPFIHDGGLINGRNILQITSDSIMIDNGYSISILKKILKRHYTNKGNFFNYSESPYNALVEVSIDTSRSGKELKQVLLNLTRTFDEIKEELQDSIKLNIYFSYLRQIKHPPPPPKE